jgi:archaellum component FlaC
LIKIGFKKSEILIYIFAAALVASLLFAFSLSGKYKKDIRTRENEISALEEKVAAITNAKEVLQQALMKAVRTAKGYQVSAEDEANRRKAIEEQVVKVLAEMSSAKQQIKGLEEQNGALKSNVDRLEKEKENLANQVSYLKRAQETLQRKIKRLLTKADVELGQVVVTPASMQGKILKANSAYNFIIVDLGKNDGLKPKTTLMAYRDSNPIGAIIVEQVYDELSVCKADFKWEGDEMMAGYMVRGKE